MPLPTSFPAATLPLSGNETIGIVQNGVCKQIPSSVLGGSGPVNSVGVSSVSLTVTGSPITSSGTIHVELSASQIAALVGYADPRSFTGYDNTGATDQTTCFNLCIQAAIAAGVPMKVPAGKFLFNGMLVGNLPGTSAGRSTFYMEGAGSVSNGNNVSYGAQTLFISGSKTLPILSLNCVYGAVIRKIGFLGGNTAGSAQQSGGAIGYPVKTLSSYVSSGYSSLQFAPYAAIVVDAFNVASAPMGGGYPGQAYNQNTGSGSSGVLIEDCAISAFVVGIACGISGSGQQCDNLRFNGVNISGCDTNYVFCSPNSHSIVIDRGQWAYFRIGINSSGYWVNNVANPNPPNAVRGIQANWYYRFLEASSSGGPCSLIDIYTESSRTYWTFGGGASSYRASLTVRGGSWKVATGFGSKTIGLPPLQSECYAPLHVLGATMAVDDATTNIDAWNFAGDGGGTTPTLEECSLPGSYTNGQPPFFSVPSNQNFGGVLLKNCWVCNENTGGYPITDEGLRAPSFQTVSPSYDRVIATGQKRWFAVNGLEYYYIPGSQTLSITVSALTLNATTVTFTAATPSLLLVGDILMWKFLAQGVSVTQEVRAGLKISSIAGSAVTCSMLWDPAEYDVVANQPSTTSLTLLQVQWAPTQTLTAVTDGSTAVLTSVNPTTALKTGDWVTGNGIPSNSRVISGGGTGTVTLNNNTTSAGTTQLTFGNILSVQQQATAAGSIKTSNYTLVLNDASDGVIMSGTGLILTIPANASVPFPLFSEITVVNSNASALSIACTSDTLTLANSTTTGTRTLAQNSICTLVKTGPTNWLAVPQGGGLT